MRTLTLGLAVAACLLLLAPDALAGDWSFDDYVKDKAKSQWDGCGVGSMTHRKMTQNVVMPGQGEQNMVQETKKTVKEITETEYVIEVEKLSMGQWTTTEEREKKVDALTPKIEEQGKETLTIAGTEYECVKRKVVWMEGETEKETVVIWEHAEKGMLKMNVKGEGEFELTVEAFDGSWTVGDQTFKGRTFEMKMSAQGMEMKGSTDMSTDVPEGNIRFELKGAQGPVQVTVLSELIAFVKK